jgi:hypothetical protein
MSVQGTAQSIQVSPVRTAIANAASATGMDFGFLLATAVRESSLDPRAEARTSSATGLFQFIDQTWLATVKRHGPRHGMGAEASLIEQGSDGVFRVDDPAVRRRILDMRYDPELSARMAAELASDNADAIRVRAGVEPQFGDLYAAHFLGPAGASDLIIAAREQPWASAADLFPQAARANRPVFYDQGGRARSVVEVLDNLRATASRDVPDVSARDYVLAARGRMAETPAPFERWPSFAGSQAAAGGARIFGAALAPLDNDRAALGLLGTGADSRDGASFYDPAMLAQVYGAEAAAGDAATAQAISLVLSTGSIARALSPSADSGPARSGSNSSQQDTAPGASLAATASPTDLLAPPPPAPASLTGTGPSPLRGRN